MKQKWRFKDTDLCCDAWNVETVLEGLGVTESRGENTLVPFRKGRRAVKKFKDQNTIILAMWVRGIDLDNSSLLSYENLIKNQDKLNKLFGSRGLHRFERTLPSGEVRETLAEVSMMSNFEKVSQTSAKFTVDFVIPSGVFVGAEVSETLTVGTSTLTNEGTSPQDELIIKLKGPLVNPKLENLNNKIWIQHLGRIETGEEVIIKTDDYKITKGDLNMVAAFRHGGDPSWFVLEPGANELKLTSDLNGTVELSYRPAFY